MNPCCMRAFRNAHFVDIPSHSLQRCRLMGPRALQVGQTRGGPPV